ncbi:MAG: ABC transporter ATP-binding protein [Algisphaera sp.]
MPALLGGGVLSLDAVGFAYSKAEPVLRSVTASLAAGRVAALVGPNGAGKSTLLRLLLGQLNPTAGQVAVAGQAPGGLSPAALARCVSYVPQGDDGGGHFTVEGAVAMGRFVYGDRKHVDDALDRFELRAVTQRVVSQLSGGQRQRVRLARVWAQSRGVDQVAVLADEPVAGLDLKHAHGLMESLRELAADGRAVLVVLHDLALAARYADDVWLLKDGVLERAGPAAQVLEPAILSEVYDVPLAAVQTPAGRLFYRV